jgi:hypothetical protein
MHESYVQPDEDYSSPEYEPVQIDANMFTDDDSLWILATEEKPTMTLETVPTALLARSDQEERLTPAEDLMLENLCKATDKYEAAPA